jgi:tRNA (guanine37-N1)-methyltransferase
MRIDVITIFPDYLEPARLSLLGRATDSGLITLTVHDLRQWTDDVHRTVDDSPYGGGPGMVMRPEPWGRALDELAPAPAASTLIVPTPSGWPLTQARCADLAEQTHLIIACGRYEGIDQRVLDDAERRMPVVPLSIGDYVLAGGEVAALVIIEAVTRLIPGVVGNAESVRDDSFAPGAMAHLVEGPVYTRPATWRGLDVPEVLRSGDHAAIARYRAETSRERTLSRRPDLAAGEPH